MIEKTLNRDGLGSPYTFLSQSNIRLGNETSQLSLEAQLAKRGSGYGGGGDGVSSIDPPFPSA
jgi:hypothetical protein